MDDKSNRDMKPMSTTQPNSPGVTNGDYLSTFAQPVYYQGAYSQPMPMQTLPPYMQQPCMQQPYMQQPYTQPYTQPNQVTHMPEIIRQRTPSSDAHSVQFTDYEQLSMLTDGIPLTAESVQYLNGFMRTQIGRRVKVEFLIGTNMFIDKVGTLLGVGVNFIVINEIDTDDITACDFYNIRFITFYY